MAVISQTNGAVETKAPVNLTRATLTASDTLTYTKGSNQTLLLVNPTASIVTATLTGATNTNLTPDGFGGSVSTTGGRAVAVPANGATLVGLDDIWAFLTNSTGGTVTVSGGTGLYAMLYV